MILFPLVTLPTFFFRSFELDMSFHGEYCAFFFLTQQAKVRTFREASFRVKGNGLLLPLRVSPPSFLFFCF